MPSKVPTYINGRFVTQPMTGVQRYAYEISRRLVESGRHGGFGSSRVQIVTPEAKQLGRMRGNLWEQVNLLAQSHDGILFSPGNVGPWLHRRQLLTIHDIGVYDISHSYSSIFRAWVQVSLQALTRTAKHILTVSNYSKARIVNKFNLAPENITVVYPGADHILDLPPDMNVLSRLKLEPRKYVLAVGSLAPHKNLPVLNLIDWRQYGVKICIVGTGNSMVFQQQSGQHPFDLQQAVFAGRIPDSELRALYTHALAFIFPSSYEGFGTPPLEAMYCGCPVIASNATSIPEVCGEGALYFNPKSGEGLQVNIERILSEPGLREQQVVRGSQRAEKFGWDITARNISELLQSMQG